MMLTDAAAQEGAVAPAAVRPGTRGVLPALILFALCVAGAVLRFLFLARKPFWFDECFSVTVARLDWPNFLHLLWWREGNMSLYYLLLRAWLHFGGTVFFIRGLSVILAIAGLPAIYWLAGLLFDRRTAIVSVALLTVNAYHIRYAQEARSYSLFFLLALLSGGYFCAFLRKPSRENLLGYALTSILAVYTHFYALLLLGTQGLAIGLAEPGANAPNQRVGKNLRLDPAHQLRRAWIRIGAAVSPLVIFIAKTGAGPIRWIQRSSLGDIVIYYERLAGNGGWPLLALYLAACATFVVPFGRSLFSRAGRAGGEIWRVRFLLLWALFPVLLTALLSLARPLFLGRYFIFCLPPFVVLAAAGLARLKRTWHLGMALAVILLFSVKGTLAYYDHDFDVDRDGIGPASNYVLDHAQPGDAVIFHIAGTRAGYEFYRSLRGVANDSLANSGEPGPQIIYPRHGDRLDYRDFTGKPTPEFLRSILPQYDRVWVVLMNNVSIDKGGASHADATTLMLSAVMEQSFPAMQQREFPSVEVRLYRRH